jgi:hypothetical protein
LLGCLRNIITLAVIIALCAVGYFYRDRLQRAWNDLRGGAGSEVAVQPAAPVDFATSANRKLESIADGPPPDQIVLSSAELQAVMKKRFAGMLPGYVDSARVELNDGKVRLSARVPTSQLPQLKGLGQVASFLPDTTEIAVTGQLIPLRDGRVAIGVDGVSASKIPLPHRIIPEILSKIRRSSEPGLPSDALAFPLPPGASTAYVRGDSLVILTRGSRGSASTASDRR